MAFAVADRSCAVGPSALRASWTARLAAAGVAVEAQTEFTLYFRDPDGRRVALSAYDFGT
jgi:hypothetical protein